MVLVTRLTKRASVVNGYFLRLVQVQGRSSDTPGFSKNASGSVGIPLKGVPQVPGEKFSPSEKA